MDFHNMKRKQLQALCKKHNISANLTSVEMADKLSSLFKGKEEKRLTRGRSCLKKVEDERASEKESDVVDRKVKKVRFSPESETFEFVKSGIKGLENTKGGRRRSVLSKVSLADEIVEIEENSRRVTRFTRKNRGEGDVFVTKKRRKGTKDDGKVEVQVLDVVDVEEGGGRVNTRRTLRNKGITVEEKHENVGNKNDGKGKGEMFVKHNANVAEDAGTVTTRRSSRNKGLVEEEKHRNVGKKTYGKGEGEILDEHNLNEAKGTGRVDTRRSSRNKGIVEEGKHETLGKRNDGRGEGEMLVEHNVNDAKGVGRVDTRRSSRNKGMVDEKKHETVVKRTDRKGGGEILVDHNVNEGKGVGRVDTRRSSRNKGIVEEKHETLGKRNDGKAEGEMLVEHNVNEAKVVGRVDTRRSSRNKGIVEEEKHETVAKRTDRKGLGEMLVEHNVNEAKGAGRVDTRRPSRNKGIVEEEKHETVGERNDGKADQEMLVEHNVNEAKGAAKVDTRRSSRNKGIVEEEKNEAVGKRNDGKSEGEMLVECNLNVAEGANRVSIGRSLRNKGVMDEGKHNTVSLELAKRRRKTKNMDQGNAKGNKELLEIDKVVEDVKVQTEKVLRRSKRKVQEVEGSVTLMETADEKEVVGKRWSRRTKKAMVDEACKLETESKVETKVNVEEKPGPVTQVEELKNVGLKITRRKSVIPSLQIKGDGKDVSGKNNTLQLEESPKTATRRSARGRNLIPKLEENSNNREKQSILQLEEVPKVQLRTSNKNKFVEVAVETAGNDVRNGKQSKVLKPSNEKGKVQAQDNLRRSKRNDARDEHAATTTEGENRNLRATPEREASKRRRAQDVQEGAADIAGDLVERVPKQSSANARNSEEPELRLSPIAPNQSSQQRVRRNKPIAVNNPFTREKERVLIKGSSDRCYEDLESQDVDGDFQNVPEMAIAGPSNAEFVMDNFAKSSANEVLSNNEGVMESTILNTKKSGQKSHKEIQDSHDGISATLCGLDEANGLDSEKLEDNSPAMPVDVAADHTEVEVPITKSGIGTENVNVSLEINTEKSPENYMLKDNDEKEKDQLLSNHLVELQCIIGLESPRATDFAETNTSSHSLSNRSAAKLQGREAADQPSASKAMYSSSVAVDHVSEDEAVQQEPMFQPESTQGFGSPVIADNMFFGSPAIADNTLKDLGDDVENDMERDEASDLRGDEKQCGPVGHVNEEFGNSAEEEHLHIPEDNIFTGSVTIDRVDEDLIDGSCRSMDSGQTSANANPKDGEADVVASPGRDGATSDTQKIKHEEDLANSEKAKAGVRNETVDDSELPQLEHTVGLSNSRDFQTDEIVHGDGILEKEQIAVKFTEYDETRGSKGTLNEHGVSNAHDPSERRSTDVLLETSADLPGSSLDAADMQGCNLVSPDVGGKFSRGKVSAFQFSSSSFSFMHMSSPKANSIQEHEDNEIPIGTVAEKENSPSMEAETEGTGIETEEMGDIHLTEVQELKIQATPATVQHDGPKANNSCMGLEEIMDDSDGQLVRGKMGYDHNSASVGEDLTEKEGLENCLGDRCQPLNVSTQHNDREPECVPSLNVTSEREQLGDLFATLVGVSEMTEEKDNFNSNSERMAEAFVDDKSISLPEGEQMRKLFATPIAVSKTDEEKECVGGKSDEECEAFDTELPDVGASPYNNQETYDGSTSKSWQECDTRNLFSMEIKSTSPEMENDIINHEAEMRMPSICLDETVAKVDRGEVFSVKVSEHKKCVVEKKMKLTSEVLDASPAAAASPEDQLRVLFATPMQSTVHSKEGETLSCNQKMAEDAMSSGIKALRKFEPQESLRELGSGEVIENITTMGSDDGNITNEIFDEAKVDIAVNKSTCSFSEDKSAKYEISKEQTIADLVCNAAIATGTELGNEEKNDGLMLSSGTASPDKEATDGHSNCLQTTPVCVPNDLDEPSQSDVKMTHDNVEFSTEGNDAFQLMEIFDRSETRILRTREMASSFCVQENSATPLHPADETKVGEGNALEAEGTLQEKRPDFLADAAELELNAEEKDSNAVASNEAICTHASSIEYLESVESEGRGDAATLVSNLFHKDDELRKESDEKTSGNVEDNVVAGTNVELDMRISEAHEEQPTNIETIERGGLVSLAYSQELVTEISDEILHEEITKACSSPCIVHSAASPADDEPAAVDAEVQLVSGFEMIVSSAGNANNETSSANSLCLENEEAEDMEESSDDMFTGEQSGFSESQMLRKEADISCDVFGTSGLSASEGHEVLKESEVAAAIKEYIDSETNENVCLSANDPAIKDYVHSTTNTAEMNVTEHASQIEPHCGSDGRPTHGAGENGNRSAEEEPDERIDAMETKEGNLDPVSSRGFTTKRIPKLQRLDATAEKGNKLFGIHTNISRVKSENRSILIHGTPLKSDMKENAAPASKAAPVGSLTSVRPRKRPPLKNLPWK